MHGRRGSMQRRCTRRPRHVSPSPQNAARHSASSAWVSNMIHRPTAVRVRLAGIGRDASPTTARIAAYAASAGVPCPSLDGFLAPESRTLTGAPATVVDSCGSIFPPWILSLPLVTAGRRTPAVAALSGLGGCLHRHDRGVRVVDRRVERVLAAQAELLVVGICAGHYGVRLLGAAVAQVHCAIGPPVVPVCGHVAGSLGVVVVLDVVTGWLEGKAASVADEDLAGLGADHRTSPRHQAAMVWATTSGSSVCARRKLHTLLPSVRYQLRPDSPSVSGSSSS